ncbi:hypothetical protein CcaCcLH18_02112 [Colletotrichum camelliae]|nr:hypothetical protein CcaCcLH18_02112 [Colletotrichum camelliae]
MPLVTRLGAAIAKLRPGAFSHVFNATDKSSATNKSDPRPGVAETYPDFIDKASENDTDSDAEISVPETDGDFAWEFSARSEVPFGDVDVALEKWTEARVSHTANYFVVPYAKNNDFVGRRNILHQLKSQLNRSQSQADSIPNANAFLFGERGIGKTQIALAYVYGLQNTQPEVSVFWVNAHDTQSFRQAYASIAQETQIPGRDDPTLNLLSLVQEWLERGPLRSWLMVIDGVEGEQPHGQIGPLSRFIPRSAHGSILVTTRKFQLGQTLTTEGTPIEVGKLDVDESKLLLRERLEGYDFDPDDLPPTTLRVGHKPLALIQAAASLQRRAVSLSDFPQLIQQYDLETAAEEFKKQNKELPERRLGEEHHGTLLSMVSLTRPRHRGNFEIAVVCALPLEYDAATLAFDEFWDEDGDMFGIAPNDPNSYTTGRIGQLNVVLALLPNMGKASSSGAAAALRSSYYGLKLAILAGICGGVPGSGDELDEMILGDVVISRSVFQFDLGSQYTDTFSRKDTIHDNLGRSNHGIRSLLAIYESDFGRGRLEYGSAEILEKIQKKAVNERRRARYGRPAPSEDSLFKSTYLHLHQNWEETGCGCSNRGGCDQAARTSCRELGCDEGHLVPRDRLTDSETQSPQIFIGNVASGDTVMKSGDHRDKLAQQHGIIAFETEGAGIWDQIPCIIVKGVCDYADSHRNKKWQPYAAVAAASVTKALLERYIQEDKPRAFQSSSSSGRVAQQFTDTGSGTQNNNSGEGKQ